MKEPIRLALAQINCTVGDLSANCTMISGYVEQALSFGTQIVCFPELTITGYPPEDLLLKPQFITDNLEAIKHLALLTTMG